MARKKKTEAELPEGWVVSEETQINGRHVQAGTEISVHGVKGRLRFIRHVKTETAEWIDARCIDKKTRSFRPEAVKTVHYTTRTRENLNG